MNSIVDDKKGIFNKLSVFTSLKEIELKPLNGFNSISSINNNKDPLPFLLDLSTSLVGTDGLQDKLGLLFTQFIDLYNQKSKEIIKSNLLDYNQNELLPSDFLSNGFDIPVTSIDDFNNLRTPKSDPIGELVYDETNENLQTKLREAITTPNVDVIFGNINIVYNEFNDSFNIKPINSNTIGDFIDIFINSFSGINVKEFVTDILDKIYGTKSKSQNKTLNELNKENTIDVLLDKIINDDELVLTDSDNIKINNESDEIYKGLNQIDFGCGVINNILTIEDLTEIANKVNESSNPNEVGNLFTDLFINSLDENTNESNITNLKDSFFKKILNLIKTRLLKDLLFSPEKKILFILFNLFENQTIFNLNSLDYLKINKNIVDCLVKDIISDINEFIFNLVKTEIIEITKPALRKIITEKINNYKLILTSLTTI